MPVPRTGVLGLGCVVLAMSADLAARQAPTLTVSIKGSTAYAQPTPVPAATALLVVTPSWDDIVAKSPVGGREAGNQPLALADLAVVLSNKELDCTSVFGPRTFAVDADFLIVAGKAEAYLPAQGYHTTPIGKVVVDTSGGAATLNVDRFSLDASFTVQKRKSVSKENLRGNDGRLVLQRTGTDWTADFMVKADELSAEGKLPLKWCGLSSRKKAAGAPLLGERRLLTAAERFGM